jgi:cytidine deaminase
MTPPPPLSARIVAGCNVENASYGLTLCAERGAFAAAIAQGVAPGGFAGLVVVGDTPGPILPCGACRQVMLELGGPELPVWLCNAQGAVRATTAGKLLPDGFVAQDLHPGAVPR